MPKFQTQYEREKDLQEEGGGELVVEREGYIPVDRQVGSLIEAGERLQSARREYRYDDETGEEDDLPVSPIFDRGSDPVEREEALGDLARRLKALPKSKPAEAESDEAPGVEAPKDGPV